jgi:hypothetical protein
VRKGGEERRGGGGRGESGGGGGASKGTGSVRLERIAFQVDRDLNINTLRDPEYYFEILRQVHEVHPP